MYYIWGFIDWGRRCVWDTLCFTPRRVDKQAYLVSDYYVSSFRGLFKFTPHYSTSRTSPVIVSIDFCI